jgi:hypothetical protein
MTKRGLLAVRVVKIGFDHGHRVGGRFKGRGHSPTSPAARA